MHLSYGPLRVHNLMANDTVIPSIASVHLFATLNFVVMEIRTALRHVTDT